MATSTQITRLELRLTSDTHELAGARKTLEKFFGDLGVSRQACDDIGLCVNEALANVIRHAYKGAHGKPILVEAQFQPGRAEVKIRDWGNGVNPQSRMPVAKDPLTPGGLGLVCLRQLMDDISYQPQSDGMLMMMSKKV